MPGPAELEEYLEQKGVKNLMKHLLTEMLTHRPENPVLFMVHYLKSNYPDKLVDIAGNFDNSDYDRTYAQNAAGTLEESNDEYMEDDQNENNTASAPVPSNYNRGRRIAVSAEPVRPEDLNTSEIKKIPKSQEEMVRIGEVIRGSILFSHLDEDQRAIVAGAMFKVSHKQGDVIIRQGDDGDNYYVIDSGQVEIFVRQSDGSEKKVLECGSGEGFGELALMYNAPRAATVKAKSDCDLWAVDRVTFKLILMNTTMQKREKYESILSKVPLLQTLHQYERSLIADTLKEVYFEDGEHIFEQGDHGDCFYIIDKGAVDCFQTPEGKSEPINVGTLKEGQYFGEIALLTGQPRVATVIATGPTKCLCLDNAAFNRVLGPLKDLLRRNLELYNSYISIQI
eukprot:TRINITY_DN3161_c0_g1::TRINITY_DN3161_c0_g1_i1::g.3601::m.3601 TRINITY_DN3161_c0_g1::TRINITY_DN3161_c0_g1_i1::g.3601  ORF type:complete len:419 (-),score=84.84,sp/P31319/KAPR_APLCA/40.71/3e-97,cNMP_binding/PF00027.24/3.5e-24,cNMP_binding/PF00027.24/2.9e-22,Dpy-30/PF05186.8/0.031,RIIa/PF02197.12/0.15 TRINITY_DN3161_c0_g1_i1:208-1395(-)